MVHVILHAQSALGVPTINAVLVAQATTSSHGRQLVSLIALAALDTILTLLLTTAQVIIFLIETVTHASL